MEAKYTKGEWGIIHDFNVISKSDNRMVAQTACYSTNTDNGEHAEENKANAKLIAAAPQMVDALLKVVQTYNIGSKVNGMPSMTLALAEAICNAETVLKEATE